MTENVNPKRPRRSVWYTRICTFLFVWNLGFGISSFAAPLVLWYGEPAKVWTEALPLGNGRLGAMQFGGLREERLQFNEDTLWTGQPHEYHHPGASEFLPTIRKLLSEGKQREAEKLAMKEFMSVPLRQQAYQPFGDLRLEFPGHEAATDYRRELDLDAATATVRYRVGDVTYQRTAFVSHPDQVIVLRIGAVGGTDLKSVLRGRVSFTARLDSPHKSARTKAAGDHLVLSGQVEEGGLKFEARLAVLVEGGKVSVAGDRVAVENADAPRCFWSRPRASGTTTTSPPIPPSAAGRP